MTALVLRLLGLAGALTLAGWMYFLTAKVLLLLDYAEQLLGTSARLLAVVPGQSAPRTAGADEKPRTWFARLRALADLRQPAGLISGAETGHAPTEDQVDDELARWEDDGGTVDDTPPVEEPVTEPMRRIDVAGGLRLPDAVLASSIHVHAAGQACNSKCIVPEVVDPWRAQFTFAAGGRRR